MGRPKTKLTPTKDDLYHEYVELGLTHSALNRKYGDAYVYLKHFGIPLRGHPLPAVQSLAFSQRQLEIVYGTMMGDGYMTVPGRCRSPQLSVEHSVKQEAYVLWLHAQLAPFVGKLAKAPARVSRYQGREIVGAGSIRFRSCVHPDLLKPYSLFCGAGRKLPSDYALSQLTPLSLAVWFMDDGSGSVTDGLYFCTGDWPEVVQLKVVDWFASTYGLSAKLRYLISSGYRIVFPASDGRRLLDLISPHMCESMLYKVK